MSDNIKENFKHTKKALEWRRDFVLSKLSVGWSQQDIAAALHLHPSTISLDVLFLKEQARDNLRHHLQEKLPFEHLRAVTGINSLIKKANDLLEDTTDRRLKLQTINTLANLYAGIITMASDGNIIQQAIEKVELIEDIKKGKYEPENVNADLNADLDSSEKPGITTIDDMNSTDIVEEEKEIESEEDIPIESEQDATEEEEEE
jgi:hypothetical protein